MKRKFVLLFSLLILGSYTFAADIIFGIYATTPRNSNGGTGFLISNEGDVVTAYHVLQNSTSIEINSASRGLVKSEGVTIRALDVEHDLAIINIPALAGRQGINFSLSVPGPTIPLKVVGYPRGMPNAEVSARTISSGTILSSRSPFRTDRGLIFANGNVEIIPLDMTIYGGMSGAPLMDSDGNAIGVVSGSINEGGSFAWAIPIKYVKILLNKQGNRIYFSEIEWPKTTLLASYATTTARSYSKRNDAFSLRVEYKTALDRFRRASEKMKIDVSSAGMVGSSLCNSLESNARSKYPTEISSSIYPALFSFSKKTAQIYGETLKSRLDNQKVIRAYIDAIKKVRDRPDLPEKRAKALNYGLNEIELRRPELFNDGFERINGVSPISARNFEKFLTEMDSTQSIDGSTALRGFQACNQMYSDISKYNVTANSSTSKVSVDEEIAVYEVFSALLDLYVDFIAYK